MQIGLTHDGPQCRNGDIKSITDIVQMINKADLDPETGTLI